MPDTKISALTSAGTLDGTEPAPIVQAGSTVKATVAQIAAYMRGVLADLTSATVGGYRNRKVSLTGAQTLNTTTCKGGDTLIFTGAAATWTLPTRLVAGDTGVTESVAVHNRGSGAITFSASGVTIKGSTGVPIDASCTMEWETNGTTHWVWVRSTA